MVYNLTSIINNSTTILSMVQGVNQVLMFGLLGTLFLIGIIVVAFTSFMFVTNDTNKSVAATAFIAFTLSLLLKAINLIPNLALFITLIGSGAAIAFVWKRQ